MAGHPLNPDARRENIRALSLAAGISEEEAGMRLEQEVLVTYDIGDAAAALLAEELMPVLSRTLPVSTFGASSSESFAGELVIGQAAPRSSGPHVFAALLADRCVISRHRIGRIEGPPPHSLNATIAACYVAGAAIARAVGDGLSNIPPDEFEVPFDTFIDADVNLSAPVYIDEAYLAGAGAIGSGFLWAARHVDLRGRLHVVDDDWSRRAICSGRSGLMSGILKKPKPSVFASRLSLLCRNADLCRPCAVSKSTPTAEMVPGCGG
jgi:hypothetical protein